MGDEAKIAPPSHYGGESATKITHQLIRANEIVRRQSLLPGRYDEEFLSGAAATKNIFKLEKKLEEAATNSSDPDQPVWLESSGSYPGRIASNGDKKSHAGQVKINYFTNKLIILLLN